MTVTFDWESIPEYEFQMYQYRVALVETLLDEQIDRNTKQKAIENYCTYHGVTRRTIYSYVKRYKRMGPEGLLFYHPRPLPLRIKDRQLRKKIRKLVEEDPARSLRKIRELLSTDELLRAKIAVVSDRTVYRFLAENGMSQKERYLMMKDDGRRAYHKFEAPHSMALVQGDARDGIWLVGPDGKPVKTYLFLWLCDYSRKILFGKYYKSEKLPCMEDSFKHMALRFGLPLKIYLDNGSVYISRHFSAIMAALKIKKIHHKPYRAYAKGKIESVNKTIDKDFQREAQRAGMRTLEELNTAFWAWSEMVYNKRIHSVTGQAPDDRFLSGLPKEGNEIKRIEDIESFSLLFLEYTTRTVTKYGKIKLHKNEYPVQCSPHGTVVNVRYDMFDLGKIYIYSAEGTLLETTTPSKLVVEKAPHIPEESKKSAETISKEAVNYFASLRGKYLQEKKNMDKLMYLSSLNKKSKEANDG